MNCIVQVGAPLKSESMTRSNLSVDDNENVAVCFTLMDQLLLAASEPFLLRLPLAIFNVIRGGNMKDAENSFSINLEEKANRKRCNSTNIILRRLFREVRFWANSLI